MKNQNRNVIAFPYQTTEQTAPAKTLDPAEFSMTAGGVGRAAVDSAMWGSAMWGAIGTANHAATAAQ